MKQTIINIRGTFSGFYEWGRGWSNEKRELWKNYWDNEGAGGVFWHHFRDLSWSGDTDYLVAVAGSVYLHPMSFTASLTGWGEISRADFDAEIHELYEKCRKCAEVLGGSFTLEVSGARQVEFGKMKEYEPKVSAGV